MAKTNFEKVAQIKIDVAFNSEAELEKFFDTLCSTKTDLDVKVVGDFFSPQDVSEMYKTVVTPCTCDDKDWYKSCPRHGKHAYA